MADVQSLALDEIRRVAAQEIGLPRVPSPDDDLVVDLNLDSVGLLTLVVALEDRVCVKLEEQDAARVRTVSDLVALVVERTAASAAAGGAP